MEDVFLVVQVAESSLIYDQELKTPLYAKKGILEPWIVEVPIALPKCPIALRAVFRL